MASRNTSILLIVLACVGLGMLVLCGGAVAILIIGTRAAVEFVGEEFAYTIRPPGETGYLWASQGWLFFARSRDEPDVEPFLMSYLRSVRGAGASAENAPSVGDAATE